MSSAFKNSKKITQCTSYHGISVDLLSSGVQKSIGRRADVDVGVSLAREWILFGEWSDNPTRGKAVLSNFQNRIFRVMIFEDILAFVEIPRLLQIHQKVSPILDKYKTAVQCQANASNSVWSDQLSIVLASLPVLASMRKYRIGDEMNTVYRRGDISMSSLGKSKWMKQFMKTLCSVLEMDSTTWQIQSSSVFTPLSYAQCPKDQMVEENQILGIHRCEDVVAITTMWQTFFTLFRFVHKGQKETCDFDGSLEMSRGTVEANIAEKTSNITLRNLQQSIAMDTRQLPDKKLTETQNKSITKRHCVRDSRQKFWSLLQRFCEQHQQRSKCPLLMQWFEYCYQSFKDAEHTKESFLYPLQLLLACIHRRRIPLVPEPNLYSSLPRESFIDLLKTRPVPCKVPDYAIDMHTFQGGVLGKDQKNFALKGCKVLNMDPEFYVDRWHDLYIQEKLANSVNVSKNNSQIVSVMDSSILKIKRKFSENESTVEGKFDENPEQKTMGVKRSKKVVEWPSCTLLPDVYIQDWRQHPLKVVFCHRPTAVWKPVVLLDFMHDVQSSRTFENTVARYVYKGPFDLTKANTVSRLNLLHRRSVLLDQLGLCHPHMTLCIEEKNHNMAWIRMDVLHPVAFLQLKFILPSVSITPQDFHKQYAVVNRSVISKTCNGWYGHIATRESMGVIRLCDASVSMMKVDPQVFRLAYMSIFVRSLFEPGNCGSWNTLIRLSDMSVFSVDFDQDGGHHGASSQQFESSKYGISPENWPEFIQRRALSIAAHAEMNHIFGLDTLHINHIHTNRIQTIRLLDEFCSKLITIDDHKSLFKMQLVAQYKKFFDLKTPNNFCVTDPMMVY